MSSRLTLWAMLGLGTATLAACSDDGGPQPVAIPDPPVLGAPTATSSTQLPGIAGSNSMSTVPSASLGPTTSLPAPSLTGTPPVNSVPGVEDGPPMATSAASSTSAPPVAAPPPAEPAAGYVRRLTHIEYDNTLEDLLGVASEPALSFVADTAQDGFTNNAAGLSVSPTLAAQYLSAAEAVSNAATQNLDELLGCDLAVASEETCIAQFVTDFGRRAWRRPLSPGEQERLLGVFRDARQTYELGTAVKLVVQVVLQSPQFIYILEPIPTGGTAGEVAPLDSWQVASRLSYFLLGSMPDEELFLAAEAGTLDTPEAVATQARRLLQTSRARERVGLFFTEWLRLRNMERMQKDPEMFPSYDLTLGPLMQEQVVRFTQAVTLDQAGTVQDLLTAPFTFVNTELAELYGVAPPTEPGFARVELDATRRAGLLTHVGVMAALAKADQTDPVHRGKFVREGLLCGVVPPPPPDANVTPPVVTPDASTRERFSQHRADPACAGCHTLMDPIGLGFEHYDALGQWRDTDNGFPVDATGEVFNADVEGTFDGAIELAGKLAESKQVKDCFARTWFRFALGRSDGTADEGSLAQLSQNFEAAEFRISELLVALTQSRAFLYQRVPDPNTSAFAQETP